MPVPDVPAPPLRRPYACPECRGSGKAACPECDQETDCDGCGGDGLDGGRLDREAFRAAVIARLCPGRPFESGTWEWIAGGVAVGRRNRITAVAYAEFAADDAARASAPVPFYHEPAQRKLFDRPAPDEYAI